MPASAKIVIHNLHIHYGEFQALHGVSMQVRAQRVTALIGPSGCGKSAFLRTLNRMHETIHNSRVQGEILLDRKRFSRWTCPKFAAAWAWFFRRPGRSPSPLSKTSLSGRASTGSTAWLCATRWNGRCAGPRYGMR